MQADFDDFDVQNMRTQKQVRTQTFEGEAEMFLKNEERGYLRADRLVRAQPLRFCGCG